MGGCALPTVAGAQFEWQPVSTPAETPAVRTGAVGAWDPVERRALFFGGTGPAGPVDEAWWWDPVTAAWHQQPQDSGAPWPGGRSFAGMAFDEVRQVFVLFGGQGPMGLRDDLWIFDPADRSWTDVTPASRPSARSGLVMVWSPARSSVILHGGNDGSNSLGDLWAWNGANFGQLMPGATSLPAPTLHRHVGYWESWSNELVVMSGVVGVAITDQMWAYDPGTALWRSVAPATLPPARQGAVMVPQTGGGAVLYGGLGSTGYLDDLWGWNGEAEVWTDLGSPIGALPSGRGQLGVAWDSRDNQLFVFGGTLVGGTADTNEIVRWDLGATPAWTIPTPGPWRPQARRDAVMGYSEALDELLLFGGEGLGGEILGRAWGLDAATLTWQDAPMRSLLVAPRSQAAAVALGSSGSFLLFGGLSTTGAPLADSWIKDTALDVGREVAIGSGPSARFNAVMAFDEESGTVILFGGEDLTGPLGETWQFDPVAETWAQLIPSLSPSARTGASMVSLPGGGVLLYGGHDAIQDYPHARIFDVNANTWSSAPGTVLLPGPVDGSLALDRWSYELIHFGGASTFPTLTLSGSTQTYDGLDWFLETPSVFPSARMGASLAGVQSLGGVALFGGFDGSVLLDELWWGSQPSPDPIRMTAVEPDVTASVCPPGSVTLDLVVADAQGREALDPSKHKIDLSVTLMGLGPQTEILASDLASATPLPSIAQVGTTAEGHAGFTLAAVEPGSGSLLVVAASLASSNLSVPIDLVAGPVSETESTLSPSPDPAVAGVDVVTLTFTPRDACLNLLGPAQSVSLASDVGTVGLPTDLGDGRYEATLTTTAADCSAGIAHLSAQVGPLAGGNATLALSCPSTGVDPASPVTSPLNARACARQGIFAELTITPRNTSGAALPAGRSVSIQEDPPFLVAGQVRESTNPSGEPIYRIEVGSNRCGSTPVPVPIIVDGVSLSTAPRIHFECEPVNPATISLTAPVVAVPADGATPALLEVVALDACGNPAHGRAATLEVTNSEVPILFTPRAATTLDLPGDPTDATAAFEARSAQEGTFDLRATVDGRSAILPDVLTFLASGGLVLKHESAVRRAAPGQAVTLKLQLENTYDEALDAVVIRPVVEGLSIRGATDGRDLGDGRFLLGGIPRGSVVTLSLEALVRPGQALATSEVGVRFLLRGSGLEGIAHSNRVSLAVEGAAVGGCECGTHEGPGGDSAPGPSLAFAFLLLVGLASRARRS